MKILVPFDGSPAASAALAEAIALGRLAAGSEIVLLNVQSRSTLGLSDTDPVEGPDVADRAAAASEAVLGPAAAMVAAAGVVCEQIHAFGEAAVEIERLVPQEAVTHVVMGTRGHGKLRGLVLGSVAAEVVRRVDVPVMIVRRPREA